MSMSWSLYYEQSLIQYPWFYLQFSIQLNRYKPTSTNTWNWKLDYRNTIKNEGEPGGEWRERPSLLPPARAACVLPLDLCYSATVRGKNRWSLYAPVSSCIQTWIRATWYGAERVVRVVRESCEASEWCWLDFFFTSTWQKSGACIHGHALHTGSTDFFPPFSVLQPAGGAGLEITCPLQDYAFYFSDLDVKTHIELYVKMCRTSYSGS